MASPLFEGGFTGASGPLPLLSMEALEEFLLKFPLGLLALLGVLDELELEAPLDDDDEDGVPAEAGVAPELFFLGDLFLSGRGGGTLGSSSGSVKINGC